MNQILVCYSFPIREGLVVNKVTDVAWDPKERLKVIRNEVECSIAPEICIEITSPTNTKKEMKNKRKLYFSNGATEVLVCDENGDFEFFYQDWKIKTFLLVPNFSAKLHDA